MVVPQLRFYDLELSNAPETFVSPNTCKTRYTLNIKNIPYETKWVHFDHLHATIAAVTKSGKHPTVPIIEDIAHDDKPVQDSWEIALYLEKAYPDSPSLFHGGVGVHRFFYEYCNGHILPHLFKMAVLHIWENIGSPQSQAYFRQAHEARLGTTLENFAGGNTDNIIASLKRGLAPVHTVLKEHPFVTGDKPGWADCALAGSFNMVYSLKPELFESTVLSNFDDDVLRAWWNRMEKYRF